jgi:hypothetical protein
MGDQLIGMFDGIRTAIIRDDSGLKSPSFEQSIPLLLVEKLADLLTGFLTILMHYE